MTTRWRKEEERGRRREEEDREKSCGEKGAFITTMV